MFSELVILEIELVVIVLLPLFISLGISKLIIKNAGRLGVVDSPGERKLHDSPIPTFGGVAVLGAVVLGSLPFVKFDSHDTLLFTLACTVSLTILGAYDDLKNASPLFRLVVEVALVAVLFYFTELSIAPLVAFFGIDSMPVWVDLILTVLFCVGMINAFNFMDGINGLSGGIFVINFAILCVCFYFHADYELMVLTGLACAGTMGFLRFNFNKAGIFLGDCGSISLGFLNVVCVLYLMDRTAVVDTGSFTFDSVAIVTILIIPGIDMLKVIIERILKGKSPMVADNTHLHHLILARTNSHLKSTVTILCAHLALIITLVTKLSFNVHLLFSVPLLIAFFVLFYSLGTASHIPEKSKRDLVKNF